MLPAFAQVSSAPPSSDATRKIAPRRHLPIRDLLDHGDGTVTSSNWSGYAVTGSAFTRAEGSWIVPKATCSSGVQYPSFWVGIDGYLPSSQTVEQTGTDSDCDGSTPVYYAWYEFYPAFPVNLAMKVAPGDHMSAKVVYSGSLFTITMTNETTGATFSKSKTVANAQRTSAEWIAEAPCCTGGGGVLPLADFTEVLFGKDHTGVTGTCDATDSTKSGDIGVFPTIEEITMEKGSIKKAIPSALSSDGTSFSVTWHHK